MDHHRVFRCWRYFVLALTCAFSCSSFAQALCTDVEAQLTVASVAQLRDWYTGPFNSCISSGVTPSLCGGANAEFSIESQASPSARRSVFFSTRGDGSVPSYGYLAWVSCKAVDSPPPVCDWAKGQTQVIFGTFQIERGKSLCSSGCKFALKADAGVSLNSSRLDSKSPWMDTWSMGDFAGTGTVCDAETGASTGSSTPSPYPPGEDGVPPKDRCPEGKVGGTVNGTFVCVTPGETSTNKTNEKTTDDGKEVKKESTNKATSCQGDKCTTDSTTTTTSTDKATGAVSTSSTTTEVVETKTDYCEANSNDKACLGDGSGSFTGSCKASFECSGDAVQCAMAKEQYTRNCQTLEKDTDPDSVVNQALSGKDKLNTDEMKAAAANAPVGVGSFDTSGRGWSRSCPADPVIPISWGSGSNTQFSIPFSRLCAGGILALLANGAVAITLLGALAWVIGTKASSNA